MFICLYSAVRCAASVIADEAVVQNVVERKNSIIRWLYGFWQVCSVCISERCETLCVLFYNVYKIPTKVGYVYTYRGPWLIVNRFALSWGVVLNFRRWYFLQNAIKR